MYILELIAAIVVIISIQDLRIAINKAIIFSYIIIFLAVSLIINYTFYLQNILCNCSYKNAQEY